MKEGGEQFLNEKYPDLQKSEEIESAVARHEKRQELQTGRKEKIPNNPKEKIEVYLDRLEEVFVQPDEAKKERREREGKTDIKERRVDILKDKLHELFVIKPEEIPESYFNHQKKIAREQGHGDIEITDQIREQMAETIIHDQEQSLNDWVDYLCSSDATYPNWLKYFAFRSITKLSEYDKEKKEFKKRSKGTTASFPDINREALAYVLDAVEKSHKKSFGKTQGEEAREDTSDEQWEKLLKTSNFGKLYAHAIEKITPASEEEKEQIQGEWVKYEQGSDAEPLYKSLQGQGTGWCTAGEGVAKAQLELGDFYVFYSKDKKGENKIPRVAIRMQNNEITEVRGINADQNLEPVMTDVAKEKMKELPGAEKYEKKVNDMKRLTEVERKFIDTIKFKKQIKEEEHRLSCEGNLEDGLYYDEYVRIGKLKDELEEIKLKNQEIELTKEELRFLYEIDGLIDGFGYEKDPRIEEILSQRNLKKDLAKVFACEENQIAVSVFDLKQNSVALCESFTDRKISELPKSLRYIGGDVNLSGIRSAEGLELPEIVKGRLDLNGLHSIIGLKNLPKIIGGTLYLNRVRWVDNLKFPQFIGKDIYLNGLASTVALRLPEAVGGTVYVQNLTEFEKDKLRKKYPKLNII